MTIKIIQGNTLLGEGETLDDAIKDVQESFTGFTDDDIENDYTNGLTAISTIKRNNIGDAVIAVDEETAADLGIF